MLYYFWLSPRLHLLGPFSSYDEGAREAYRVGEVGEKYQVFMLEPTTKKLRYTGVYLMIRADRILDWRSDENKDA